MACKYCGKPVVLVPSAAARARKHGGTAAYYTSLFPNHSECVVQNNREQSLVAMRKAR